MYVCGEREGEGEGEGEGEEEELVVFEERLRREEEEEGEGEGEEEEKREREVFVSDGMQRSENTPSSMSSCCIGAHPKINPPREKMKREARAIVGQC